MLRWVGAVLLSTMVAGAAVRAETLQAQFIVQAIVPPRTTLEAVESPARLLLTEEDIDRGYKDVAARYRVQSNTRRGWLLRLAPRRGVTQQVEVRGLSGTVLLREETVEVYRPRVAGPEDVELDYRFVLATGVEPGSYELPVHVSVTPL